MRAKDAFVGSAHCILPDFCYNGSMEERLEKLRGFAPVADESCRVLILGTAPSVQSLREGFYYAHPRNAFWRLLSDTFGAPVPETAGEKAALLLENRLALWDVLRACARRGSLDSAIRDPQVNDFDAFFAAHPGITRVLFNGAAAEKLFFRFCGETLQGRAAARLPSTSPACTLPYARKLELWRKELLR